MKLKNIMLGIFLITAISLIYIQMQVTIYDLAYQGKVQENKVFDLSDDNNHVSYNIAKLKSTNHLGDYVFDDRSDLIFLDRDHIVNLRTSSDFFDEPRLALNKEPKTEKIGLLARIFSLKSEAEAGPIQ